ncbi:MAG: hypothetical protein LBQ27_03155 [Clostridiales bacterium]|jgi:RNA polymerase subunit RPABC4/transcription elongation factor Spt4|nr:hypothetical protein [Clostridiales bacterium]
MRICEHCGAYVGDGSSRCTICGVKVFSIAQNPNLLAASDAAAFSAVAVPAVKNGGVLTDPNTFGEHRLSDIGSALSRDKIKIPTIAPYITHSANKPVPNGPTYACKNCGTVNSVDDVYCVVCGLRATDRMIRDAVKSASGKNGAPVIAPPSDVYDGNNESEADFSTSLNTLEAKLKPYVYNLTINGDNATVNNSVKEEAKETICPFAAKNSAEECCAPSEVVAERQLTPEEIEMQRSAVIKGAKKGGVVRSRTSVKRHIAVGFAFVLSLLIIGTFFFVNLPYTQAHDVDKAPDVYQYEDSSGGDIVLSLLEIIHMDDLYESIAQQLNEIGININGAYYTDAVLEQTEHTDWQRWFAQAVPVTLLIAFILTLINLIMFFIKLFTGTLKRKIYFITLIQTVFFLLAAGEVFLLTQVFSDVFVFDIGYGFAVGIVLSIAVLLVERLAGRKYPKSEKDRIKSLYGY